jgi:hypothetical protein
MQYIFNQTQNTYQDAAFVTKCRRVKLNKANPPLGKSDSREKLKAKEFETQRTQRAQRKSR